MIQRGDRLVLGLSGGPDSLCLLHILHRLQGPLGFTLHALHLNHLMRGETAMEDEAWLKDHCASLGVEFRAVRCDVRAKAAAEGICEEEAGRAARHETIEAYARELGGKSVFAHNQDDQAETVLLRMLRGTGVHGLAAMEYVREDGVVRPLLDTPRKEIEAYCASNGLQTRWDSTNASMDYTRNRLRMILLPQLEEAYNPNIKNGLARLASNAREDDDFIRQAAAAALQEAVQTVSDGSIEMNLRIVRKLHPAVYARVIPMAFAKLGLTQDIADVHLSSLRRVIASGQGGKTVEFPHGYKALVGGGKLVLQRPLA